MTETDVDSRVRGTVSLPYKRAKVYLKKCSYPSCNERTALHIIPKQMKCDILKKFKFYIPKRSMVCNQHSNIDLWFEAELNLGETQYTKEQIIDMFELLHSELAKSMNFSAALDHNLQVNIQRNTALTLDHFQDLLERLPSLRASFRNPNHAWNSLYMYLMKMRTALPDEDIARIFKITRVTVERQQKRVREAMNQDFIFEHVNYVRNREELINSNTIIGSRLFCADDTDRVLLICDGTYIYINKSRNYEFQKKTYTDQKKRNFVKIMMCLTCDGTITNALGPFPANENDAEILRSICENSNFLEMFREGDVFILDRGFRDCVNFLKEKRFGVKMPALLQKSQNKHQLSTEEANETRLVTATRYVVETRNGHLKTIFKMFDKVWNPLQLKHLMDDVSICSALINLYFKPLISNRGMENEIADRMLRRVNTSSILSKVVAKPTFERNLKKFELFDDFESLPLLTERDLIYIALGRYQIKQAESYCQEHLKENDSRFPVFILPDNLCREFLPTLFENDRNLKLLLVQLKSRFVSKKRHNTFILIDENGTDENVIVSYCCDCFNGARTVGCCSHVMCLVWFTLFKKNRDIPEPASFLDKYFPLVA